MRRVVFISLFLLMGIAGYSQNGTLRVDARQKTERARIHNGKASGEITNREATALNEQQRHIRRSERRAESDGEVTKAEKRKLERRQDRASRSIRRAKKNDIAKSTK